MSSDDEEEDNGADAVAKRHEMSTWFKFCKQKVDKIEKVWNKKLEDPDDPNSTGDEPSDPEDKEGDKRIQDEKDQYEQQLQEMFANFGKRTNLSRSFSGNAEPDPGLVQARKEGDKAGSKDDMDVVPACGDNQFWKMPDMYDLDELMKEYEEDDEPKKKNEEVKNE